MGSNNNKIHGIVFILKTSTLFRCIFFMKLLCTMFTDQGLPLGVEL